MVDGLKMHKMIPKFKLGYKLEDLHFCVWNGCVCIA